MVIIRGFKGEPFVAWVCSANKDTVYVTGEENYKKMVNGYGGVAPLGITRNDVYTYDKEWYNEAQKIWRNNSAIWEKLTLWEDKANV